MPLTEKQLLARDAKRDIGKELLESIKQVKSGRPTVAHLVPTTSAAEARTRAGFSQAAFAVLLGVSVRTLQEWEQGRRQPSGAARTLISIASARPEVLRDMFTADRS